MSAQPFAFQGALQLAADQSLPPDAVPFNASGQYSSQSGGVPLNLSGSGTISVPFGTVAAPGAKLLAIRYDANQQGAQPVLVSINGGAQPLEVSPGGFIVWVNPNPAAGVTSCSIAYTASCQLRVWVLG
jgi:hypothetical protein